MLQVLALGPLDLTQNDKPQHAQSSLLYINLLSLSIGYFHYLPHVIAMGNVFLDIGLGGVLIGRLSLRLYDEKVPKTCENFRRLVEGTEGIGKTTRKPLRYKGSLFHRVIRDFMLQGGDFSAGDGTGGESVYGGKFDDERTGLYLKHDRRGLISMANAGPDTNGLYLIFFLRIPPPLVRIRLLTF